MTPLALCPTCEAGELVAVGASTATDRARADDEGYVKCSLGCGSFTEEELTEARR